MPALREIFAEYDVSFDRRRALQRGNRQVSRLRSTLQRLTPTVTSAAAALGTLATAAGVGAAAGLQRIISSTVESTREIERWSGRLSISSTALRSWIELGREYGASVDDVTDALKELQLKAQDAISGGTAQAEMFERIGISLDDLRPIINDTDALMALFTTRLNEVNDVALRNFTVDELMSDAGTRLNQVFALGTQEIARRRGAITQAMGPTEGLARLVLEHTQGVIQLTRRWERFKREITMRVLPVVADLARKIAEFEEPLRRAGAAILRVVQETNLLKGALVGVGIVAAGVAAATIGVWGPVVAVFIGMVIAVAAVAVVFDQLSRTIDGAETALREYLDQESILGEGGTEGLLLLLSDRWENLKTNVVNATGAIQDFITWMEPAIELMRTVWRLMSFATGGLGIADAISGAMGGSILEQAIPTLREASQERLEEERASGRSTREQRAENERISALEEGQADPWTGRSVDISGQDISVPVEGEVAPIRPRTDGGRDERDDVVRIPDVPIISRTPAVAEARLPRQERAQPQNVSIDAPANYTFNIAEATDSAEVARMVTNEVETSQRRMVTELESMISDRTEVGS